VNEDRGSRRSSALAPQVYRALREQILTHEIAAGKRLVESEIAGTLKVSRTPVREAIRQLEAEGLVRPLPRGGVVAVDVRLEIQDRYGLRARIEGYAAYLAATRRTADEVDALRRLAEEAGRTTTDELAERARSNDAFHLAILEASHYPRLHHITTGTPGYFLDGQGQDFYAYPDDVASRIREQHLGIVDAIFHGEAEKAELLTRMHFEEMAEVERAMWDSGEPQTAD
jgi:DNA-binding GntR family transcriptional regulator